MLNFNVGTELLTEQNANTNSLYISNRMADVIVNEYYQRVVDDSPGRLK